MTSDDPTDLPDDPRRLDKPRPLEDERDALERSRAENADTVRQLGTQGVQVTGTGMLSLRLEMLAEAVLGPEATSTTRLRFELSYEAQVTERLAGVSAEANRARLLQGVPR